VPKHTRRYADLAKLSRQALARFLGDVRDRHFPTADESFD